MNSFAMRQDIILLITKKTCDFDQVFRELRTCKFVNSKSIKFKAMSPVKIAMVVSNGMRDFTLEMFQIGISHSLSTYCM